MASMISVGTVVTVPSWPNSGDLTVKTDHGNEVTLSNGERIYKAKCVINIRATVENKRRMADKIGKRKA